MKKTLAILLSLALVICMIPATAFAETYDGVSFEFKAGYKTEFLFNGNAQTPELTINRTEGGATTTLDTTLYELQYFIGTENVDPAYAMDAATYTVEAWSTSGNKLCSAQYAIKAIDMARATISMKSGVILTNATDISTDSALKSLFEVTQDNTTIDPRYYTLTAKTVNGYVYVTATAVTTGHENNVIASAKESSAFPVQTVISDANVTVTTPKTYTGKAIETEVVVKHPTTGYVLTNGRDYTVTYANNVNVSTAGATATITPIGSYNTVNGQPIVKYFGISQKALNATEFTVTVPDAVYNEGAAVVLSETVYFGTTKLVRDVDYTISVSSNAIGTSTAYIQGKGNFSGVISKTFNIVDPAKNLANAIVYLNSSASRYSCYYNGYAQTPSVAVFMNGVQVSSSYYNVVYTDNVKVGTATVTVNGKNGYGGTATTTFDIKSTVMDQYNTVIGGVASSYTYTGLAITPTVSVSVNGKLLTPGVDYTVSYSNNTNVSTGYSKAKVYIYPVAGSGYSGSASKEFTIVGKSMYGVTASFKDGVSYSEYKGTAIKPTIVVKEGYYTTLREYTDYTVTYKDAAGNVVSSMKDAGTYTVVITGKGNYSGELTLTYTIKGVDMSYYNVTLNKTSAKATGAAQTVSVTSVKYGTTALKSTDYTVSYQNAQGQTVTSMTAPGTYKVVVTGKGGYFGSTYATFVITGEPQTVTLNKTSVKAYKDTDPFKITAKATGDGNGFVYTSSNPEVATVNAYGVVTIHSIGRAKITATTVGMKKSEEASASVVVKVYPDKVTVSKKPWTEGKKGSLRVRWNTQEDVTYYEVRYSRDKSFKAGTYKTKKVTASEKYDTQSTRLADLKSGKTYYVKVRAVKVVYNDLGEELKYYGAWSGWRSAKTQ